MPSLKVIRKRITSVQSTQKITRAMKMVAGARLNRAQTRITELRPYAVKTQQVLAAFRATQRALEVRDASPPQQQDYEGKLVAGGALVAAVGPAAAVGYAAGGAAYEAVLGYEEKPAHPLLVVRPERRVLLLVLTSDRGLCGAFNTNINKRAEREWHTRTEVGQEVKLVVVGRKGRDYMARREAPVLEYVAGVWDKLGYDTAKELGAKILAPLNKNEVDAIYIVYNEFKSAMTQQVTVERLFPVADAAPETTPPSTEGSRQTSDFIFEPHREALLEQLVPMYVDISILRALYESQASELGARMTAMDAATKNAKEMIGSLKLQYNKARQAAITKELMEIIGGSEALKE